MPGKNQRQNILNLRHARIENVPRILFRTGQAYAHPVWYPV
jgi:hypothetical protein